MSGYATISSDVLVGLYDMVCAEGVDPLLVSEDCALSPAVWFDGGNEVPLGDFVHILEQVAHRSGRTDFGWRAGQTFDLRYLGELGDTILAAPTLGTALKTFSDGLRLIQTTTELKLEVEGDRALMGYRILDPDIWPRRQDAEFTLSILSSLLIAGAGDRRRAVDLAFEHGAFEHGMPNGRGGQQPGQDRNGPLNVMSFPVRLLDTSMSGDSRSRWQERSLRLRSAMVERNRQRPISAKTESAILRCIGKVKPSQQRIAADLGFSVRSLHRHLKAEGESFSGILTDCRLRFAKHMLAFGDQPLSEIALELGFEDQSCLSRFFQGCTGQSPSSYRDFAVAETGCEERSA